MAAISGRGATHNQASSRFNLAAREADGDWLDAVEAIDGPAHKLRTSVSLITPRTIISRNASPDIAFPSPSMLMPVASNTSAVV